MPWIIKPKFRRSVRVTNENRHCERAWRVWKYEPPKTNVALPAEEDEVESAVAGTIRIGDPFTPARHGVVCSELILEADERTEMWSVTARYEIPPVQDLVPNNFEQFLTESQVNDPSNPLGPDFSGNGTIVEEYYEKDLGTPSKYFINSAWKPYQNVPAIFVPVQVDRVSVNERNKPDTSKVGTANGRKLFANVSYQSQSHKNTDTGVRTKYSRNTYEVWTHPYRDWAFVDVIDMGMQMLMIGDQGQEFWENIVSEETNEPVSEPVPLNGLGLPLAPGVDPITDRYQIRKTGALGVPFLS